MRFPLFVQRRDAEQFGPDAQHEQPPDAPAFVLILRREARPQRRTRTTQRDLPLARMSIARKTDDLSLPVNRDIESIEQATRCGFDSDRQAMNFVVIGRLDSALNHRQNVGPRIC